MRNVSNAYKRMLYYDQRNYICTLDITLADGTKLTVNNDNIMDGGIEVDDAISEDGDFTALGSTVIRGCTVTLYNNNEMYSDYEFKDAKVIVKINLKGADASDEIQLGEFTVDEPTYGDFAITLSLLDNMYQFDREYASYNIYTSSTTLFDIVADACTKCGVLYDSSMTNFPNRNFVVPQAPKDKTTYREVLGWCATLAGCFARITDDGKLIFQWFNTDAFDADDESSVDGGVFDSASPYATGDNVNGGTFNPWNDPASKDGGTFTERNGIHYITALNTQNIGVDDVVVTGIRVTYDIEEENSVESVTKLRGTDDYVIDIDDNPFITNNNYVAVLDFLQPILIGLQFRTCNVTHPNDPTIQAGDVGYIWDSKGAQHRILITRATFNPTNLQTIVCSAKSPIRNSSARLSTISKALAKATRHLNEEKAVREQLEEDFARRIADSAGLYWTKVNNSGGGYTVYAHDKQLLADSSTVLKINSGAIATTGDYTGDDSTTTWYGQTFDGTWLANIISTMSLFFDYAHGGTLKLGGNNNTNGLLEIYAADGTTKIGSWNKDGIEATGNLTIKRDDFTLNVSDVKYIRAVSDPNNLVLQKYHSWGTNPGLKIEADISKGLFKTLFLPNASSQGTLDEVIVPDWYEKLFAYGVDAEDAIPTGLGSVLFSPNTLRVSTRNSETDTYTYFNSQSGYFTIAHRGYRYGAGSGRPSTLCMLDLMGNSVISNSWDGPLKYNGINFALESSSSRRYKHNIKPIEEEQLDPHKLLALPIVQFEWNDDHPLPIQHNDMRGKTIPGIIAEDVEEIYPAAAIHDTEGRVESWDERRLIPGMLALIQEQDKKIKELEARLAKIEEMLK